ncbi:hypothetical protein FJT64_025670 [Amphibalanus amphitrite]|uniref:Uncharacterized protein n=1 Tax=Amphibalanus amphitrite TaxID=1232801 RepID=A0A6A4W709_AMPAM|nr:hypothetical protein FJT64_025670 [Amphibalanus amphitrite]
MVSTGPVSTACPSTADTDTIELVETVQLATGTGLKAAQPAHCRPLSRVLRIRVFQPALGVAISWLVAGVGNTALMVVTGLTLRRGHLSDTLLILCVIEIVLVAGLSLSAALVVWIDYRVLREHAV